MRKISFSLPALCNAKRCNKFDLQCFAEGGAPGSAAAEAGTGTTGGASEVSDVASGETHATEHSAAHADGQDAAAAEIPKQQSADDTPPKTALPSERDKAAEFEKLIRGEYKEQFAARTQRIIDQRFRQAKAQTAQAGQESEQHAAQTQRAAEAICENWRRESEALKTVYPNFDLHSEVKTPAFTALLKAGVPVRTAYEACHLQQLLGGAMQYTADKVSAAVAAKIADRAARPAENGTTPRAGAVMRADVSQMSREEREALERRVARGERIRF